MERNSNRKDHQYVSRLDGGWSQLGMVFDHFDSSWEITSLSQGIKASSYLLFGHQKERLGCLTSVGGS